MEGERGVDRVLESQPMSEWWDEHFLAASHDSSWQSFPPPACPLVMQGLHFKAPGHVWQGCRTIC